MKLFERFSRLVKADAHGVMDSLEERSLLLKQHLREAELALARQRARADALEEEKAQLEQQRVRLSAQISELDEDVERALAAGKQELARFAVRQLIPKRRTLAALEERVEALASRATELAETLPAKQRELDCLRSRVRVQLRAAEQRGADAPCLPEAEGVADEEVELELLRRRNAAAAGGV
jgi:phage shock protein A